MKHILTIASLLAPVAALAHVGGDTGAHHGVAAVLGAGVLALLAAVLLRPGVRRALRRRKDR